MDDIRVPPDPKILRASGNTAISYIISAPTSVKNLADGQVIQAEVIAKTASGQFEIATALGKILVQTNQVLIPGKVVTLTILQQGDRPQVQIQAGTSSVAAAVVSSNSPRKPVDIQDKIKTLADQIPPLRSSATPLAPIPALPGVRFPAIFVPHGLLPQSSKPSGTARGDALLAGKVISTENGRIQVETDFGVLDVPNTSVPLATGNKVQVQVFRNPAMTPIISPDIPENTDNQKLSVAAERLPASVPPSIQSFPKEGAAKSIQNAYGGTLTSKTQSVFATIADPKAEPDINKTRQQAEVIFVSDRNVATLRLASGLMTVQTPLQLQIGQPLLLDVEFPNNMPNAATTNEDSPRPLFGSDRTAALLSLLDMAKNAPNSAVIQFMQTVMPQAGSKLVNQMALFLSATTAGDSRFWIGPKLIKELEKDHIEILNQLDEDFSQIQKSTDESTNVPWRHVPMPIADGRQLHYVQMFFKNHCAESEGTESGQRFIVETKLSNLGTLQLDGFVRQNHFDLMCRSYEKLPTKIEQDIRTIFQDYMELSGWDGQIGFQAMPDFPVNPHNEIVHYLNPQKVEV